MSSRSGYIYLIEYPNKHYKIGRGKSAITRHRQLQRTAPTRIYLLWSLWVEDMFAKEDELHQLYGVKKDKSGEYFRLSEGDVKAIAGMKYQPRGEYGTTRQHTLHQLEG